MPEFSIPNFLGGLFYDIDPIQLACNQFSAMSNMTSERYLPFGASTVVGQDIKAGLSSRGSLRKLVKPTPRTDLSHNTRCLTEVNIIDDSDISAGSVGSMRLFLGGYGPMLSTSGNCFRAMAVPDVGLGSGNSPLSTPFELEVLKFNFATVPGDMFVSVVQVNNKILFGGFLYYESATYVNSKASLFPDRFLTQLTTTDGFSTTPPGLVSSIAASVVSGGANFSTHFVVGSAGTAMISFGTSSLSTTAMEGGQQSSGWFRVTAVGAASDISVFQTPPSPYSGGWRGMVGKVFSPLSLSQITCLGQHKFRALIGTFEGYAANLYIADAGNPSSIQAANVLKVGDYNERLIGIVDVGDSILLFKEHSIYQLFLNTVYPSQSTLVKIDSWRGSVTNRWITNTPYGPVWLSRRDGLYLWNGQVNPLCPQLKNILSRVSPRDPANNITNGSISWVGDRVHIALPNFDSVGTTIFGYDMRSGVLERTYDLATTAIATALTATHVINVLGSRSFTGRLKVAPEVDYNLVYECDYFSSANYNLAESAVTYRVKSKKFSLGRDKQKGQLQSIVVDWNSPNLTDNLTITPFLDGSSKPDIVIAPTAVGFNRSQADIGLDYVGHFCEVQFSGSNPLTAGGQVTTLYRASVDYELIPRFD